ncbi:hypothetical protein ONJ45_25685, partial [Salmonella enterica subsp. enterica serovar Virginia]|nr:hypothetical protein [Salmonella enterica subsp. enterica serovar Virginia]
HDVQHGPEDLFFQFCEVFQLNKRGHNKRTGLPFLRVIAVFTRIPGSDSSFLLLVDFCRMAVHALSGLRC